MSRLFVVIPVYNQTAALAYTLHGFAAQPEPYRRTPIIVVDDGSTEAVEPIVAAFSDRLRLVYKRLERVGRATARNLGAREAAGEIVVFCDADRVPEPGFLAAHAQAHQHCDNALVVGQVREIYVADITREREKVLAYWQDRQKQRVPQYCRLVYQLYDEAGKVNPAAPWISTFSGNMSLPISQFHELGGFDEGFREWGFEHFEFGYRAYRRGISFRYQPQAGNIHLAHRRKGQSYEEFIRRSHRYFLAKHPDPVVEKFLDFMLGRLSLQAFIRYAARQTGLSEEVYGGTWMTEQREPQYVRITNF